MICDMRLVAESRQILFPKGLPLRHVCVLEMGNNGSYIVQARSLKKSFLRVCCVDGNVYIVLREQLAKLDRVIAIPQRYDSGDTAMLLPNIPETPIKYFSDSSSLISNRQHDQAHAKPRRLESDELLVSVAC